MILDALLKIIFQPMVLGAFALLIAVSFVIAYLNKSNNKSKENTSTEDKMPYLLKDSVLTQAEFAFAGILAKYVKGNCIILTKVSLHDVFEVQCSDRSQRQTYFNKISSKHVDFLVCDKTTFKPLYGIELDDSSHDTANGIARDEFKDKLYDSVNLPLIRIKCKREYTSQDFAEITRLNTIISAV